MRCLIVGFGAIARGAHWAVFRDLSIHDIDIVDLVEPHWGGRYLGTEIPQEGEYDIALIASLPAFHCPHTLQALKVAKKVLCEKPPALNAVETLAMINAAEKLNRSLLFGFHNPFRSSWKAYKAIVGAEEVIAVKAEYRRQEGIPPQKWFREPPERGGGVTLDLSSHLLSLVYDLISPKEDFRVEERTIHFLKEGGDYYSRAQGYAGKTFVEVTAAWRDPLCSFYEIFSVTATTAEGNKYQYCTLDGFNFHISRNAQPLKHICDSSPYKEEWIFLLNNDIIDYRGVWVMNAIDAILKH